MRAQLWLLELSKHLDVHVKTLIFEALTNRDFHIHKNKKSDTEASKPLTFLSGPQPEAIFPMLLAVILRGALKFMRLSGRRASVSRDLERRAWPHTYCDANVEGGSDSGKER